MKTKRLSIERGYRQTTPELECTMRCCVTKRFMKWRVLMRLSCVQQTTKESNNWFYTIFLLCLPPTNSLVFFITCQRFILWKRVFLLGTTSWKVLSWDKSPFDLISIWGDRITHDQIDDQTLRRPDERPDRSRRPESDGWPDFRHDQNMKIRSPIWSPGAIWLSDEACFFSHLFKRPWYLPKRQQL